MWTVLGEIQISLKSKKQNPIFLLILSELYMYVYIYVCSLHFDPIYVNPPPPPHRSSPHLYNFASFFKKITDLVQYAVCILMGMGPPTEVTYALPLPEAFHC